MTLRVMLADDHALFRGALSAFLKLHADIEVVAEVGNGLDVLRQFDASRPQVVCMDIGMDELDGIEATRQLLVMAPDVKVIGLSAQVDLFKVAALFEAGALGYVVKGSAAGELLKAIRTVSGGQSYFDPALDITGRADLAPYSTGRARR